MKHTKHIILFYLLLLLQAVSFAGQGTQMKVPVFFETGQSDSVSLAVKSLFNELAGAGGYSYEVNPLSNFKGRGIAFVLTTQAERNKIYLPAGIRTMGPEGIYIKGNATSIIIAGNSSLALREAIYFYLEKLGFRWFSPGDEWKIIPRVTSVYKDIYILTQPDYEYRSFFLGHGYNRSEKIEQDFTEWYVANRLGGAFPVGLGHSYDRIVSRNKQAFLAHPEFFAQKTPKGSIPANPKFNVAASGLVDLIRQDALSQANEKSAVSPLFMLSMDASDGAGFCTTPACQVIGTPSDQVYYIANQAANAIRKSYPMGWIGCLAYSEYITPTKLNLADNIFVMVTNGFNKSAYTTEQLIGAWKAKVSKVGVYEYLSVYEWDFDMPGQSKGGKPGYLQNSIQKFYNAGARSYLGESVMGWVSRGLGQYVLSRLLWDTKVNVDSIRNDFFRLCFEDASVPLSKLYSQWENYEHNIPLDNDLAGWISLVDEADRLAKTNAVKERIGFIKRYIHYIVLYKNVKANPGNESAMDDILNYSWRNFERPAFSTLPAMISLPAYNSFSKKSLKSTGSASWKKNGTPLSSDETDADFLKDKQSIKRIDGLQTFSQSSKMMPARSSLALKEKKYEVSGHAFSGNTEFMVQLQNKSDNNYITISSGYAAGATTAQLVQVSIFNAGASSGEPPLIEFVQKKKSYWDKIPMGALPPGHYRVVITDRKSIFSIKFSEGILFSVITRADAKILTTSIFGLNTFYFYVPSGIKRFQLIKTGTMSLLSPSGRLIDLKNNSDATFDVMANENGIWKITKQKGMLYLQGVPPYLGFDPLSMLIPASNQ
ncbi:MAG TPA: DUF4838 domain-containing protein [Chitinophagaceae bacterium]|nr:DUF4838 domain-containing protein [Chitinophagaceae bacterium]